MAFFGWGALSLFSPIIAFAKSFPVEGRPGGGPHMIILVNGKHLDIDFASS